MRHNFIYFSVKSTLQCKLSEDENGKLVSILDVPGSVLIIPQATLGGSLKGKSMQYHSNIDKSIGEQLYSGFVQKCKDMMAEHPKCSEQGTEVRCGTYGNRQVLTVDTNGPYTHLIEF